MWAKGGAIAACDAVLVDAAEGAVPAGLPVACTLTVEDGATRVRRWRALAEKCAPRAQRRGHELDISWRLDADGANELEALVASERECCAFLMWLVSRRDPDTVLTICADPRRPEDIDAIAALFVEG